MKTKKIEIEITDYSHLQTEEEFEDQVNATLIKNLKLAATVKSGKDFQKIARYHMEMADIIKLAEERGF
jgi:hypothetical protein